ncbi:diguanylate cyclase/phosphodiesterase with PAS/PAC sensor [Geminocystis sp. NIES-3708]|uniref:GGDEF domain-containing response regulator n=1 Tax=Geminocystis sp. NIES-3708 TaxID=1615909 RepID=UPI0005FC688E|nr:diguanylate cyclase [Geminocystis sp. NIES-3708]BAQ62639.1 diguanylate cyclase/phosphodiesterase with PAS/PAC sensor [Geminocystis sp. NIES-3708]
MTNRTIKILIVEDESIVAQDLQSVLEDFGYEVPLLVDSGEEAIEQAIKIKPQLILMDIKLIGKMDGIMAAEKIVEILDIPIIYLTAHGDKNTIERAKISQPFGYIIKPFTKQELNIAVEIALYKHSIDQKLKQNTRWLMMILNSIADGIIVTSGKGFITFVNPAAEKITGWLSTEALNQPISSVFNIIDDNTKNSLDSFLMKIIKSDEETKIPEVTCLINKNAIEIPITCQISSISEYLEMNSVNNFIEEFGGKVIIFRDDTQRRISHEQLKRQAFYDSLTNIPNRVWFTERLNDALERCYRNSKYLFAVLFLDLDGFKMVNDTFGHLIGDKLLIEVANRLMKLLRSIDTVARFGGDEFAILLEDVTDIEEVCRIAQRIHHDLSISFSIENKILCTNASIGIVLSSINSTNVEDLIKNADIAMYQAKSKGKGRYEIFEPSMKNKIKEDVVFG